MTQERPDDATVAARTRSWIEEFVVAQELCPFAREPLEAGRVRIAVSRARDAVALAPDLEAELARLVDADEAEIETTLLVAPDALPAFPAFNAFLDAADATLERMELVGVVQIATFHPDYRFEGEPEDDPAHYTNRSPWPVLHLLREDGVARAVARHPDPAAIPVRNVALLRELGSRPLAERLRRLRG